MSSCFRCLWWNSLVWRSKSVFWSFGGLNYITQSWRTHLNLFLNIYVPYQHIRSILIYILNQTMYICACFFENPGALFSPGLIVDSDGSAWQNEVNFKFFCMCACISTYNIYIYIHTCASFCIVSPNNAEEHFKAPVWPGAKSCNALPGGVFFWLTCDLVSKTPSGPRLVVSPRIGDVFMFVVQCTQQM